MQLKVQGRRLSPIDAGIQLADGKPICRNLFKDQVLGGRWWENWMETRVTAAAAARNEFFMHAGLPRQILQANIM